MIIVFHLTGQFRNIFLMFYKLYIILTDLKKYSLLTVFTVEWDRKNANQ